MDEAREFCQLKGHVGRQIIEEGRKKRVDILRFWIWRIEGIGFHAKKKIVSVSTY